jgi:GNAT superfamily N-acetyltransferase
VSAPPVLFPDGEIFLSTASIDIAGTSIEWGLPGVLLDSMKRIVSRLKREDIDCAAIHQMLAGRIDELLGFRSRIVQWRTAFEFNFLQDEVELLRREPAVYNLDIPQGSSLYLELRPDRFRECFLTQPHCAAVVQQNEIVSICWHGGNGAVSIATKEQFRNRGFGASCLRILTKRSLDVGIRLSIAAEADNHPAIHMAAKTGYDLTNKMYWISVPAKHRGLVPQKVEAALHNARFDAAQN